MIGLTKRERATAIVSALVAIGLLGIGATAQPRSGDRLARLESDLRYQLELGSRLDRETFEARSQALEAALTAWHGSPQTAEDYELMAEWLGAALVRSLPGETAAWPPTPRFSTAKVVRTVRKPVMEGPAVAKPDVAKIEAAKPQAAGARAVDQGVGKKGPAVEDRESPVAAALSPAPPAGAPSHPPRREEPPRPAPTEQQVAAVYQATPVVPAAAPSTGDAEKVAARPASSPVRVNLAELTARIHGYHQGLREIEAAIVAAGDEAKVAQVAMWTAQLEELAAQQAFVRLYYDTLSRDERRGIPAPRPLTETVKLVERQRQQAESAGVDDFFAVSEPAGASELAARLKSLAAAAEAAARD